MEIKMVGEHEINIKFNNSHSCAYWIQQLRTIMYEPLARFCPKCGCELNYSKRSNSYSCPNRHLIKPDEPLVKNV